MAIGTPTNRGSAQIDTTQGTLPVTTTGAIASGSKIILSAGWRTATTLSSVAGGSLTWTIDQQVVNAGAVQHAALVSADAPSGLASSTVITLTFSANTSAKLVSVEEVTGLAAQGSVFDVSATNDQASNSTAFTTGTTATTTQADELLMAVGFFGVIQGGAPTWTNSFTGLTALSSPTRSFHNGYRIVSATGTYAGTATLATTSTWQSLIGTYKMASAAAVVLPERIVARTRP